MVEVETGAFDPSRQNAQGNFPAPDEDYAYTITAEKTLQTDVYLVSLTVSWGDKTVQESVRLDRIINVALRTQK
jgi:hypothetical protein